MGYDAFAPISPACINVALVPAGRVKSSKFDAFVARLHEHRFVRLDVNGDEATGDVNQSPAGMVYDLASAQEDYLSLDTFPFELNRRAQVVFALADGGEYVDQEEPINPSKDTSRYQDLLLDFEDSLGLADSLPPHFLLIFDAGQGAKATGDNVFLISSGDGAAASIKTAMRALSGSLLTQLAGAIRGLELQQINSPRLINSLGEVTRSSNSGSRFGPTRESSVAVTKIAPSGDNQTASSKARYQIVLGAFYLQAGRRLDALRELSNGATTARSSGDYLWHGKALEYLIVAMLMLGWAGMTFEIPQICRPATEKSLLSRSVPSSSMAGKADPADVNSAGQEGSAAVLRDLAELLPSLCSTIMTLYTRASSFTEEKLPQMMMCEARIRLANLLTFLYIESPTFKPTTLSSLVTGSAQVARQTPLSSLITRSKRNEISTLLLEAAIDFQGELSNNDFIYVLTGVIPGLSRVGMDRKQAFYLKELLQKLIPCLVEARKIGAAELGIHPAAGLAITNGTVAKVKSNLRNGSINVLKMMGSLYGTPAAGVLDNTAASWGELDQIRRRFIVWVLSQSEGDILLKMESLRLCINVCEALPDLAAGLQFTVLFLGIARRTITMSNTVLNDTPYISPEEQVRLLNSIKRTVNAAPKIGLNNVHAQYWDDFLIQKIQVQDIQRPTKLIPHTSQDLALAVGESHVANKDPFIYNPFSRTKAFIETLPVLVAGETAHFAVTLQNPFEFEVEIDRIWLLTEGCDFQAQHHNIVLGPFCSQICVLSGVPKTTGVLKVTGCQVSVRSCHDRSFYTFGQEWQPKRMTKFKRNGRPGISHFSESQLLEPTLATADLKSITEFLQPDVLSITVIQPQPDVTVVSTTLTQPSLMLLEGETKSFQMTLRNHSKKNPADLLLFTFEDSVTTQLRSALENRELGPTELYEVQLQLATNPPIKWKSDADNGERQLPPDSCRTFTFEVFGKPGLTSAVVQINYATLGVPLFEVKEKFYTRQTSFTFSLTVNASVDIPRFNMLPLSQNFSWGQDESLLSDVDTKDSRTAFPNGKRAHDGSDHLTLMLSNPLLNASKDAFSLCVVDFRNMWPHPISINVGTGDESPSQTSREPRSSQHFIAEVLQPGHLSRVVLVMPRIFVSEPFAPIPAIGNQRQFVLSASKMSLEAEAASREAFWYREELLKHIRGSWVELDTGREGVIDFRKSIRLNPRMIDTIRVDHVEIGFSMKACRDGSPIGSNESETSVRQVAKSHFVLQTETFAKVVVHIRNRTKEPLKLLLRLQPSLRNQPHSVALELSKRFAWSGVLQQALRPAIEPGEVREAELGVTALVEGDFEIGATVEDVHGRRSSTAVKTTGAVGAGSERRIWHAREPCLIDAVKLRTSDH